MSGDVKRTQQKAFLLYNKPNAREGMYNMTCMLKTDKQKYRWLLARFFTKVSTDQ